MIVWRQLSGPKTKSKAEGWEGMDGHMYCSKSGKQMRLCRMSVSSVSTQDEGLTRWLGWNGLFTRCSSSVQQHLLERSEMTRVQWAPQKFRDAVWKRGEAGLAGASCTFREF